MLKDILINKNMSVYRLSKLSNIPYTTVNELVLGKKNPMECNVNTLKSISDVLNVPVEDLYLTDNDIKLSTSWLDKRNKRYIFPNVIKDSDIDLSKYHPLNQKKIKQIYDLVKIDKRINKVIVFGSSLTIRCNKDSDVDICISLNPKYINNESKDDISLGIEKNLKWKVDILWLDRIINTRIYDKILKGEVLYEQAVSSSKS